MEAQVRVLWKPDPGVEESIRARTQTMLQRLGPNNKGGATSSSAAQTFPQTNLHDLSGLLDDNYRLNEGVFGETLDQFRSAVDADVAAVKCAVAGELQKLQRHCTDSTPAHTSRGIGGPTPLVDVCAGVSVRRNRQLVSAEAQLRGLKKDAEIVQTSVLQQKYNACTWIQVKQTASVGGISSSSSSSDRVDISSFARRTAGGYHDNSPSTAGSMLSFLLPSAFTAASSEQRLEQQRKEEERAAMLEYTRIVLEGCLKFQDQCLFVSRKLLPLALQDAAEVVEANSGRRRPAAEVVEANSGRRPAAEVEDEESSDGVDPRFRRWRELEAASLRTLEEIQHQLQDHASPSGGNLLDEHFRFLLDVQGWLSDAANDLEKQKSPSGSSTSSSGTSSPTAQEDALLELPDGQPQLPTSSSSASAKHKLLAQQLDVESLPTEEQRTLARKLQKLQALALQVKALALVVSSESNASGVNEMLEPAEAVSDELSARYQKWSVGREREIESKQVFVGRNGILGGIPDTGGGRVGEQALVGKGRSQTDVLVGGLLLSCLDAYRDFFQLQQNDKTTSKRSLFHAEMRPRAAQDVHRMQMVRVLAANLAMNTNMGSVPMDFSAASLTSTTASTSRREDEEVQQPAVASASRYVPFSEERLERFLLTIGGAADVFCLQDVGALESSRQKIITALKRRRLVSSPPLVQEEQEANQVQENLDFAAHYHGAEGSYASNREELVARSQPVRDIDDNADPVVVEVDFPEAEVFLPGHEVEVAAGTDAGGATTTPTTSYHDYTTSSSTVTGPPLLASSRIPVGFENSSRSSSSSTASGLLILIKRGGHKGRYKIVRRRELVFQTPNSSDAIREAVLHGVQGLGVQGGVAVGVQGVGSSAVASASALAVAAASSAKSLLADLNLSAYLNLSNTTSSGNIDGKGSETPPWQIEHVEQRAAQSEEADGAAAAKESFSGSLPPTALFSSLLEGTGALYAELEITKPQTREVEFVHVINLALQQTSPFVCSGTGRDVRRDQLLELLQWIYDGVDLFNIHSLGPAVDAEEQAEVDEVVGGRREKCTSSSSAQWSAPLLLVGAFHCEDEAEFSDLLHLVRLYLHEAATELTSTFDHAADGVPRLCCATRIIFVPGGDDPGCAADPTMRSVTGNYNSTSNRRALLVQEPRSVVPTPTISDAVSDAASALKEKLVLSLEVYRRRILGEDGTAGAGGTKEPIGSLGKFFSTTDETMNEGEIIFNEREKATSTSAAAAVHLDAPSSYGPRTNKNDLTSIDDEEQFDEEFTVNADAVSFSEAVASVKGNRHTFLQQEHDHTSQLSQEEGDFSQLEDEGDGGSAADVDGSAQDRPRRAHDVEVDQRVEGRDDEPEPVTVAAPAAGGEDVENGHGDGHLEVQKLHFEPPSRSGDRCVSDNVGAERDSDGRGANDIELESFAPPLKASSSFAPPSASEKPFEFGASSFTPLRVVKTLLEVDRLREVGGPVALLSPHPMLEADFFLQI